MLLCKFSARWEAGTTYVDLYRLKEKSGDLFTRAQVGVLSPVLRNSAKSNPVNGKGEVRPEGKLFDAQQADPWWSARTPILAA